MIKNKFNIFLLFLFFINTINLKSDISFTQVPGSPFRNKGAGGNSIAFTQKLSNGKMFAAITNFFSDLITVFEVNKNSGKFNAVADSPFLIVKGSGPRSIAFTQGLSNRKIFAATANDQTDNITVFGVNKDSGKFKEVPSSPFRARSFPASISFTQELSNGKIFAAIANESSNNINVFGVNKDSGKFNAVIGSPFRTGTFPTSIAFTQELNNGKIFAATANKEANNVSVFEVNKDSGKFNAVADSPFLISTGSDPSSIAFTQELSNGKIFAATANSNTNNISVFEVNKDSGKFNEIPSSPFPAGIEPFSIAFVKINNLFAATANRDSNSISLFTVDENSGAFKEVVGSPFPAGSAPQSIAFTQAIGGTHAFAATANSVSNNITVYKLQETTIPGISIENAILRSVTRFVGTAPFKNSIVTFFLDFQLIGKVRTNDEGFYVFNIPKNLLPIANGPHILNLSDGFSETVNFTINNKTAELKIDFPFDESILNTVTQINGTACSSTTVAADSVNIFIDNKFVANVPVINNKWIFNLNKSLSQGEHIVKAQIGRSQPLARIINNFTINSNAPVLIINSIVPSSTNKKILTVQGITAPNFFLKFYYDGKRISNQTGQIIIQANAAGQWTFVTEPVIPGDHILTVVSEENETSQNIALTSVEVQRLIGCTQFSDPLTNAITQKYDEFNVVC